MKKLKDPYPHRSTQDEPAKALYVATVAVIVFRQVTTHAYNPEDAEHRLASVGFRLAPCSPPATIDRVRLDESTVYINTDHVKEKERC